jgi:hypothetical protein
MGSFLDCKVEPNFTKFEISKEIRNNKELKKDNKLKINKRKLNKKKYKEDNNYINYHEDLNDEEIIINTDEEQSEIREKTKDTSTKDNIKDNKKDLNNKIFISNINANNKRNKKKEDKKKETYNSEIKNDYNCFNSNEENMELDELLNKVFSNNIKTTYNNNNDKILLTESEIDKEYYEQLYSEQSQYNLNANKYINENDQKIIKKLKEIKDKITNKNNPIRKNKLKYNKNFNTVKPKPTSKSMNNKQIRNNIPNYRKHIKSSNHNLVRNSLTFDKNYLHFKKFNYNNGATGYFSLENSFNKSICSSILGKSTFYKPSNIGCINKSVNKKKTVGKRSRAFSNYSLQQSYLNNSSIFNISSSVLMNQNNKINKEKNLYKIVSNNIIKNYNKKENKKDNDSLFYYHQYRDITEVDLPSKYNEQSLINNILLESNINDKIIFNYNKLNDLNTSIIIYDGIIYKVIDKKNIGFKLSKRYFQLTKNCFRYYYEIEFAKNNNEPLVQFDIRHIKDLQIISHDFLNNIKINEKYIEFVFCIFLFQNDDFFVFAFNNENYGNSVFNILNLLKNYYEDKK